MKALSTILPALVSAAFALSSAHAAETGAEGGNTQILRLEKLVSADPRACSYRPQPAAVDLKVDAVKPKTCKPGESRKVATPRFAPAASADGR